MAGTPRDIDDILEGLRDPSWTRQAEVLRTATARLASGDIDDELESRLAGSIINAATNEKWEVRKAAALALGELQQVSDLAQKQLEQLAEDSNRWVSQAALRSSRRLLSRSRRASEWPLTKDNRTPLLEHIAARIRLIGLRSLTPARIYELAMEVGEQFYQELAADTAHEIRTLITPTEGYLVELRRHLEEGPVDATSARYIEAALSKLRQLERLVENLRLYSSPTQTSFLPTDLAAVANEAVAIGCERAAQDAKSSQIELQRRMPDGLIVDAVRERLVCALSNVVANACQAMPHGGTLTLQAKSIGGDSVELTIADTGCGMSTEAVEAAMERFGTTRRDEGGTGLGLPIAQRIINVDHGGELSIESAPGHGTTVSIVLPVHHPPNGV